MSNTNERFWLKLKELYPWFIASLVALSSNWTASVIMDAVNLWSEGRQEVASPIRLLYVIIFIASVVLLYRQRDTFFRPYTRRLTKEPAPRRKHLVLFLSNLSPELEKTDGIPPVLSFSNDLDRDILALITLKQGKPPVMWRWEMPLRAIRHHLGILQTVTLICSNESLSQAHLFLNICKRYERLRELKFCLLAQQKGCVQLVAASESFRADSVGGWDFESFDELSRALWNLLQIFEENKHKDQDVMIDFTGGQKVTSVVAATMTFNRQMKAQYVQTNDPWDVLSYDVLLGSSKTSGLGI